MEPTTLTMHTQFQIGEVDARIFGGFLEHMGRAIYEGVYDPTSAYADKEGFRTDVMDALRRMNMPIIRYPGGNFASGYHWLDGVGPRANRPTVRELAWQSIETNHFGTDEYIRLCRKVGWSPMITVNLGTGTAEEARNWVEYCNCPPGTKYADMRVANGHTATHDVKTWCLGNEMDGQWQLGHVPAGQYAIRAQQAAKMMKDVDPTLELVACGSCGTGLPTYMEWDREILDYIGDYADYVSLHRYVGNRDDDTADYLAITNSIDRQIEEMDAVCRFVQAKRRSTKRAYLCFDEWNVWYKNRQMDGEGQFAPHLIEELYNLEDALVVAGFLNSFIRHADVVKIANIAQIVNVIAPIQTRGDSILLQATFYVFEMYARRRSGHALQISINGPCYEGKNHGHVPYIDSSAILDQDKLHVFVINRSLESNAPVHIHLADQPISKLISAELLTGSNAKAVNTFERHTTLISQPFNNVAITEGQATFNLPPLCVAAMTFQL